MASKFFESIRKVSEELEHETNLRGKTRVRCGKCKGRGNMGDGYADYDSYGPIDRPATVCRSCGGTGYLEKLCSPEVEAQAIQKEIKRLQARLREIRKRAQG